MSQPHSNELSIPAKVPCYCMPVLGQSLSRFNEGDMIADHRFLLIDDGPISPSDLADVYRAHDSKTPKDPSVAIKIFREPNNEVARQTTRELEAHIALNGISHIVKTRAIGTLTDGPSPQRYVATALADTTLEQKICSETSQRKRAELMIKMTAQIIPAIIAMHDRGYIHRDIKTANFIGYSNGDYWALTDFGLVEATDEKLKRASSRDERLWSYPTEQSGVSGTPGYTAPELLNNPSLLSTKSDIFSWGVTAYRTLTGELPFRAEGRDVTEKFTIYKQSVSYEAPAEVKKLNPSVLPELNEITMSSLENRPENRATGAQWLDLLSAIGVKDLVKSGS